LGGRGSRLAGAPAMSTAPVPDAATDVPDDPVDQPAAEEPVAGGRADGPRWLTAAEQRVWRDYLDVVRLLMERLNRQLVDESGMTLAEYEVLVQLSESPQRRMRMSEIADRVVNSRSRLTHTVNRLEQRGFVAREECEDDRRGVLCVLLDEGFDALAAAAPGHVEAVRSIVFDPLDPADVAALGVAMRAARVGLRAN
jgi:DNA-binding MarR family transcriptional regulator